MIIKIPVNVYQKLRAYVDCTKTEISGFGKIKKEGHVITIEDVRIFHQVVSGGDAMLDSRATGRFWDEIIQEEGDLSAWKLWWHSHATFKAFFSGIDLTTIEDHHDNQTKEENWFLSLVTNHAGDILAQVDIFYPLRCTISNIDWEITYDNKELKMDVLDEIAEKVIIRGTPPPVDEIDFSQPPFLHQNGYRHPYNNAIIIPTPTVPIVKKKKN